MRAWLVALALVALLVAPARSLATPAARHPALHRYLAAIAPRIGDYRKLARRATDVLSQPEDVSVEVAALSSIGDSFAGLASRWNRIKAPPGLGLKNRGMGGAFTLQSRAFSVWAAAIASEDPDVLAAALNQIKGLFRGAAYLQRHWAQALTGVVIRAFIPVPKWLAGMSTIQLP